MYLHGHMMFPDYVAIAMLIGTMAFLLCLTFYAVIQLGVEVILHRANYPYEVLNLWKRAERE